MNKTIAVLAAVLSAASFLYAAERGTLEEAKAMLAKAVAHYKEAGRTQALADFNAETSTPSRPCTSRRSRSPRRSATTCAASARTTHSGNESGHA